ncbi:MAG: hypothetical protein JNK82_24810 [Myxococcaceae bacterium]|nr:hypothetical protein [Myxococcaceae bacterium]
MNPTPRMLFVCLFAAACDATTLIDSLSADSALLGAQCTFQEVDTAQGECGASFQTCVAAEGADLAVCREMLQGCLPPPPRQLPGDGAGCTGGHAGKGHGKGKPDGGHGTGGPGRHGGGQRGEPRPPPEEVTACRTALDACLAAEGADRGACLQTGRDCVRAAFQEIFAARCLEERTACDEGALEADVCARIEARCTQGIDVVPQNDDGSAACTEPSLP